MLISIPSNTLDITQHEDTLPSIERQSILYSRLSYQQSHSLLKGVDTLPKTSFCSALLKISPKFKICFFIIKYLINLYSFIKI